MEDMFYNCHSLISLDLSKFNTSSVTHMQSAFGGCTKLEYINMSNFKLDQLIYYCYVYDIYSGQCYYNYCSDSGEIFYNTPTNIVLCINESINEKIISRLKLCSPCYVIDCSENWKLNQKLIINKTGECINDCESRNIYEYNGKCYEFCLKGFLPNVNNECKCELDKCLSCPSVSLSEYFYQCQDL